MVATPAQVVEIWRDSNSNLDLTAPSVTPGAAGEIITVHVTASDATMTITGVASTGQVLTFTQRVISGVASNVRTAIYTATATGTGAITVTASFGGGSVGAGIVVKRWTGAALATTPLTGNGTSTSASYTIGSMTAGSVVDWSSGDWNAIDGATRTLRTSATEDKYHRWVGEYTAYTAHQTATSGTNTFGVSAPTGQKGAGVAIEILSAGGGALTNSPADAVGITDSAARTVDAARAPADAVGVTDSAVGIRGFSNFAGDNKVDITDSVGAVLGFLTLDVPVPDPIGITDSAAYVKTVDRTVGDAVGISDSASGVLAGAGGSVHAADQTASLTMFGPDGGQLINVGLLFRTSAPIDIAGIRYYKGDSADDGLVVTATLYEVGGGALASATRTQTSGDAVGWISIPFSAPVTINAIASYRAAVHHPSGKYPAGALQQNISGQSYQGTLFIPNSQPNHYTYGAVAEPTTGTNSFFGVDAYSTSGITAVDYVKTPADAVGITDAAAPVLGRNPSVAPSDAVGITDSASASFVKLLAPADAVGITDSIVIATSGGSSPADAVGIADSVSTQMDAVRSAADSVGITDAAAPSLAGGGLGYVTAATDPTGPAYLSSPHNDGQPINVGLQFRTAVTIDILGLRYYKIGHGNDGSTITLGLYQLTGPTAGTLIGQVTRVQSVVDADGWINVPLAAPVTIGTTDIYEATAHFPNNFYVAGNDQIGTAGQPYQGPLSVNTSNPNYYRYGALGIPDNGSAAFLGVDVLGNGNPLGSNYSGSPADSVGITDSITRVRGMAVVIADAVGIADAAGSGAFLTGAQSDSVSIIDSVTASRGWSVLISDSIRIADIDLPIDIQTDWLAEDNVAITDIAARLVAMVRDQGDAIGILDQVNALLEQSTGSDYVQSAGDSIGITDATSRDWGYGRVPADYVSVSDLVTFVQVSPNNYINSVNDTIGFTDAVSFVLTSAGALSANRDDSLAITDLVVAVLLPPNNFIKSQDDAVEIADRVTAQLLHGIEQSYPYGVQIKWDRRAIGIRRSKD